MDGDELEAVRSQAMLFADSAKDKGFAQLLCPMNDGSQVFRYLHNDPKVAQMKLDLWVKTADNKNMRGLERWANTQHGELRDMTVRTLVQAVLEAQDDAKDNEQVDLMDLLDRTSRQHSFVNKQFAHMMAKADEKAAKNYAAVPRIHRRRARRTLCGSSMRSKPGLSPAFSVS